ncbi:MAG: hypothetical protein QM619_09045 [Micropruina sp.]|uniref:hypothetical protein n=1 Tax=Micropruina sp. TaxID=2737536 RepID=UPI0039E715C8
MGKSYWLKAYTSRTDAFIAIIIDHEGVATQDEFLLRTVAALRNSQKLHTSGLIAKLQAMFQDVEVGGGPIKVRVALQQRSPASLLGDTLKALSESASSPVLICMDEVPLAILNIANNEGQQSAHELLQTLRMLRQTESGIRWILAGSIGFHHVLTACGTTTGDLNDLDNLPLGPLTTAEGTELAQRLLLGIGRHATDASVSRFVERTGSIPYLLHKVASLLDDGRSTPVSTAEFDGAFEEFIDDPDEFQSFAHLLTRLEPNYGDDAKLAGEILNGALSVENTWRDVGTLRTDVGEPERFDSVLTNLISDHYLEQRGRRVRWRYPVLQYIWARRRMIWDRPS